MTHTSMVGQDGLHYDGVCKTQALEENGGNMVKEFFFEDSINLIHLLVIVIQLMLEY